MATSMKESGKTINVTDTVYFLGLMTEKPEELLNLEIFMIFQNSVNLTCHLKKVI
jgi:hypothetical protein